ncbi:MAG: flavin reductase family protein [Pseudomonadales bacterium]|nr:flavin reductase family protein [Pseudomonadales bacterium]
MPDIEVNRELRNAMGSFATGITVVTALDNSGNPVGMTVNSFSSVSLEPPLILWCLGDGSTHCEVFRNCTHFNVNVLEASQAPVSRLFAAPEDDQFNRVDWHPDAREIPILSGALASFQCTTEQCYPGGDHTIIIGRVVDYTYRTGQPLIFSQGKYQLLGGELTP